MINFANEDVGVRGIGRARDFILFFIEWLPQLVSEV